MRLALRLAPVLAVVTLLQVGLVPSWRIAGVHPELTYCLPLAAGMLAGAEAGALVGFAAGLALDLFMPTPFGLSALVGTALGAGVGLLVDRERLGVDPTVPALAAGFAALGSAVGVLLFALVSAAIGTTPLSGVRWPSLLIVVPACNALAMLAIHPAVGWALSVRRTREAPW